MTIEAPRIYAMSCCCRRHYQRWTFVGSRWRAGREECPHCQQPLRWRGSDGQPIDLGIAGRDEDASIRRTVRDPSPRRRRTINGLPQVLPPRPTQSEQLAQIAATLRAEHATAGVVRQCLIERDLAVIREQIAHLKK